jgi:hypothetical protein
MAVVASPFMEALHNNLNPVADSALSMFEKNMRSGSADPKLQEKASNKDEHDTFHYLFNIFASF